MIRTDSQIVELVRLLLRACASLRWIVPASAILAVLAALLFPAVHEATYQNKAIAMIREQIMPESISARRIINEEGQVEFRKMEMPGLIPLDVSDYQMLVTTDNILQEVVDAWNREYAAEEKGRRISLEQLRSRVSAEERLKLKSPYAVQYYPTLELSVWAKSPEKTWFLMEKWIEAVKHWAHEVIFAAKEEIYNFIDQEFIQARQELNTLQRELNETKTETENLQDQLMITQSRALEEYESRTFLMTRTLAAEWDLKIIEQLQNYELETVRRATGIANEWDRKITEKRIAFNLPLYESEITHFTDDLMDLHGKYLSRGLELKNAETRLKKLTTLKEEHPDFLVIGKAITDDALWQDLTYDGRGSDQIADLKLRSEEINPIAMEIRTDIADNQVEKAAIPEQMEDISARQQELEGKVKESQTLVFDKNNEITIMLREKDAALEAWEAERQVEREILRLKLGYEKENTLSELTVKREIGKKDLVRQHEYAVNELERKRTALEKEIERDLTAQTGIFDGLMDSRLRASLSLANTIEEFVIISPPELQPEKEGSIIQRAVLGAAAFFVLVIVFFGLRIVHLLLIEINAAANAASDSRTAETESRA
jgi:hypothetical protein